MEYSENGMLEQSEWTTKCSGRFLFISDKIEKGKIIDSNSYYKQNRLLELGINADISPVQKDNYESLLTILNEVSEKQ